MQLTGPETLLRFDKRMAAATDGLREGLNWGELVDAGGSPAPILSLHTSHPSEQVSAGVVTASCLCVFICPALQFIRISWSSNHLVQQFARCLTAIFTKHNWMSLLVSSSGRCLLLCYVWVTAWR